MAIVVADIHGNVEKTKAFLAYRPGETHVSLGDIVDSDIEPPSLQIECLNLLFDAGAVLLWGNHDIQYSDIPYTYRCSGSIQGNPVPQIVLDNQHRFKAAHAVDGYLLTHAGVCTQISLGCNDPIELAAAFNKRLWSQAPRDPVVGQRSIYELLASGAEEASSKRDPILYVSAHRGGRDPFGGIFWFDQFTEESIDKNIRQVYGHCEIDTEPVSDEFGHINLNYYGRDICFVFDTEQNELVKISIVPINIKKLNKLYDNEVTRRISGSYYNRTQ
jgi:hypothetical protein